VPLLPVLSVLLPGTGSVSVAATEALLSNAPTALMVAVTGDGGAGTRGQRGDGARQRHAAATRYAGDGQVGWRIRDLHAGGCIGARIGHDQRVADRLSNKNGPAVVSVLAEEHPPMAASACSLRYLSR